MSSVFYLQNAKGYYATVTSAPAPGVGVTGQKYSGSPSQQWIPAQYPGTSITDTGGVVCVLYYAETAGGTNLVLCGHACHSDVTLMPFVPNSLWQMWSYSGVSGPNSGFLNLATGCVLDLDDGKEGGTVQTYQNQLPGNDHQLWRVVPQATAQASSTEREPAAAAV